MTDTRLERVAGQTLEGLLASLMDSQPGSPAHEQAKAAISVKIVGLQSQGAEAQREAAADARQWAKLSALATTGAAVIALVALLVSLF